MVSCSARDGPSMPSLTIMLLCTTLVRAVPRFDLNLDLPPSKRWLQIANYYKTELVGLVEDMIPPVESTAPGSKDDWIRNVPFDPEYEEELAGIARGLNHPSVTVPRLKWLNMVYEMDSPYKFGCADVLWAMPNGTVMFGRNLDFMPEEFPSAHRRDWGAMTYEVTFHRGGRPLMRMTHFPGEVGMHTGMRFPSEDGNGWAFAQNTRKPNDWQGNYAAAEQGAEVFMPKVRRIMETAPDFATAVQMLYTTRWAAPQYFILSGGGAYEGAVVTVDRNGQHLQMSPPVIRLGNTGSDWHIVQTNDDLLGEAKDNRRPQGNAILAQYSQDITTSPDNMFELLHTGDQSGGMDTLLNEGTLFTSVMVPATGYYKTILPKDPVGTSNAKATKLAGTGYSAAYSAGYPGYGWDDDEDDYGWTDGSFSFAQVSPGKVTPRTESPKAFLAPKDKRSHGAAIARTALALQEDVVSFVQSSLKLEV